MEHVAVSTRVFLSHRRRLNGGDYESVTTSGVDQSAGAVRYA